MTDRTTKDIILDDLAINKDHYLYLTNALRLSKETLLHTEDDLFYEDIILGYEEALKQMITEDIIKRLNTNQEETIVILEDIDLMTYIEGES